jgi:hypothetical protein
MKVTEIEYGLVVSDKKFGSHRVFIRIQVDEGDDVIAAMNSLKQRVRKEVELSVGGL